MFQLSCSTGLFVMVSRPLDLSRNLGNVHWGRRASWHGYLFVFGATAPQWARASSIIRFPDHTQRRSTFGMTLLDEWSACHRDLYLTTHKRQTCPRWDSNPQSQPLPEEIFQNVPRGTAGKLLITVRVRSDSLTGQKYESEICLESRCRMVFAWFLLSYNSACQRWTSRSVGRNEVDELWIENSCRRKRHWPILLRNYGQIIWGDVLLLRKLWRLCVRMKCW